MSAGSMRFSGYFDFYFNSIQTGGDVVQNINIIDNRVMTFTQNMGKSTAAASAYGVNLRRLALDFRLVSSSVRQIVRTMGLQDTIVGKAADGIVILASSLTLTLSVMKIWEQMNKQLAGGASMVTIAITKLTPVVAFLAANLLPVIAIVALLAAGFVAINYVWGQTSGITRYGDSIKNLKEDVEGLESSLRSLRLEQGQLGVQSAILAKLQADLDEALALGSITAEDHAAKSEMLDANRAVLTRQTAELTLTERVYSAELDQSKASIEDHEQAIKDINQTKLDVIKEIMAGTARAQPGGLTIDYFRNLLGFESGGIVSTTGPIMAHAGEELIPAGESSGGGPISLTISLEGANIYGSEGIEAALEVGGSKLRKQLEYMRMPRSRW